MIPAPDVTVGIVTWNAEEDLRRCLAALPRALEGIRAQVVVVDNGSGDGTRDLLGGHPWVEGVPLARNAGLTRARNEILGRVRGRLVVMLDPDTQPRPGSLTTLAAYLDANPRVGLAGAKLLNPDGSLQPSCRTFPPVSLPFLRRPPFDAVFEHRRTVNRHLMRDFDHATARPVDWVMGACQCYRASLLPELGRYDERIFSHGGEDTDWCMRVWKAGHEVHYVPQAEVVHAYGHYTRQHPFSRQARRGLVDYFYMQFKHRDMRSGPARSAAPAP